MTDTRRLDEHVAQGESAALLLGNKTLRGAFDAVKEYLRERALRAKTTDAAECQDIIRAMQIEAAIERAIVQKIEDGKVASKNLEMLARQSWPRLLKR